MPFIAIKNAARINEALDHLGKAHEALQEIDLRSLRGLTREQATTFRDQIKSVRESILIDTNVLLAAAEARKGWFSPESGTTPKP